MIIDVHGHVGSWFFAMDVGSADLNLSLMDRYGITTQIVSASEAVVYDAGDTMELGCQRCRVRVRRNDAVEDVMALVRQEWIRPPSELRVRQQGL